MIISRVAIQRPVTVIMSFIGLAIVGLFAAYRLPVEQFPEIEVPYVGISIPYGNATAQEVERNITRPVEEVLSTMGGIDKMYTFSRPGMAFVSLSLNHGRNVTGKGIEAKELIEGIRHRLPDDVRYIQLRQQDPNSTPVMNVMITAPDIGDNEAYDILDTRVRAELERLPGVNSVHLYGIVRNYVRVSLDPGRVAAYRLDYQDIQQRLQAANFFANAGSFESGMMEYQVRPLGRFESLDHIRKLPMNDSGLILDDLADIDLHPDEENDRRRVNGQRSLGVSVYKRPEANLVEVSALIDTAMEEIRKDRIFDNTEFFSLDSQAETVLKSLNDLRDSGILGGLLSVVVLFLFLRQIQTSLLIAATVPLALFGTLGIMYFLGMTLNILSLVGLMLAVGLLVDNSVVVSEAIAIRRRDPRSSPREAAEQGVTEVGLAITAGTLTTIIVFVPSFMTDLQQVATMQQNIAIPLCTSLLGSLLVAQTLVPTILARIPLPQREPRHGVIEWLAEHYETLVRLTLRQRLASFIVAVGIAVSGWYAYGLMDVNLNPEEESQRLELNYYIRGSMDIDYMETFVNRVDDYLLANQDAFEIENVFTSYDTDRGKTILNLRAGGKLSAKTIEGMIMKDIPELPDIRMRFSSHGRGVGGRRGGPGGGDGLALRIIGDSTAELIKVSEDIVAILEQHPMLINVASDAESNRQELRITLKPEQAGQLGVTAASVSQAVIIALGGRSMRRGFVEEGREIDIFLELTGSEDADITTVRSLPVFTANGETVPLETVADLRFDSSMRAIRRENRQTSLNLNFAMREGTPDMARDIVQDLMKNFELPPGYKWELGEEFERDNEMLREMAMNVAIAALLVYMLMAALFESILFPTTVIIAIGYSVVGVFWSLWLSGTTLTSMALTGMLLLAGIVVNNGIVLLNRIMQLRGEGEDRTSAIVQSGRHRLRPILMTVCTTVAGMLPLAIGDVRVGGMGPSYFPMARALIGGLVFSTVITLLVLPLIYVLFDDMKVGVSRFWRETLVRAKGGQERSHP